ncbi:protein SGT1 homolog [Sitodiplosis mosellana]|uniref:protein SGT1 homolog n=1 Tax=Sitodiplosis mosellana TaxID=263140 RepID=UPI002444A252|nr:protein SGT1 homolog [Sitodiplosis mosellana]
MSSVRHDWYQSEQRVVIDVLVKNANNRNISVDIQPNHVLIRGDDIELELDLAHEIDTTKSTFKIMTVKIEIILQKLVGERWSSLTKKEGAAVTATASFTSLPQQEPAISLPNKNDKNWDRVVKDAYEKEEIEKDEAKQLNSLFEKIYNDSNPEVRRAMNKSFVESGGTVLSTNWNEVSTQKVEMKPPTGTEFVPWE